MDYIIAAVGNSSSWIEFRSKKHFGKEISELIELRNVMNKNIANTLMFTNKVKHNINVLSATVEFRILY